MNEKDLTDIAAYLVFLKKNLRHSEVDLKRIDELVLKLMDAFVEMGKGT